jgi:hypothetical protein
MANETPLEPETVQFPISRNLLTSLTFDNVAVGDVGLIFEALREAGFEIEVNITSRKVQRDR